MTPGLLPELLFGAAILGGVLAGINVERLFVQRPAFRRLGPDAWAAYSRQADLRTGLVLYPGIAIAHGLFTLAATVLVWRTPDLSRAILPTGMASAMALTGLALTVRAAPVMLGLKKTTGDTATHERAFHRFFFWSLLRGIAQVLAFAGNLWAIGSVCR